MTAPARRSRPDASPRVAPAPAPSPAEPIPITAVPVVPMPVPVPPPTPAPAPIAAAQVAALALLVGELKAAIRDQGGEIALLKAQMAALLEPAPVPGDYLCLKAAAHAAGYSDEWLRQRCIRKEVDCRMVNGKWFIRLGTLARANSRIGGIGQQ